MLMLKVGQFILSMGNRPQGYFFLIQTRLINFSSWFMFTSSMVEFAIIMVCIIVCVVFLTIKSLNEIYSYNTIKDGSTFAKCNDGWAFNYNIC